MFATLKDRAVLDILRRARALITDPQHWTTRYTARDREGDPTSEWTDDAVSFCAIGAINRCSESTGASCAADYARAAVDALHALPVSDPYPITLVNDHHGHAVVLQRFDIAIAHLELELGLAAVPPVTPIRELCEVG